MLVHLHTAVQFMVFIVSFMSFVFYGYQKWQGQSRVDWEILYVVGIEVVLYSLLMGLPEEYTNINGAIPILRYMSWLTNCPVLLSNVICLLAGKRDFRMIAFPWLLNLWTTIFGLLGAIYWGPLKHVCYGLAFVAAGSLYVELIRISGTKNVKSLPMFPERKRLLQFLMITWLIFPVLFSLGPEYGAVITFRQSALFHAIGDLLSKNLMGFFSWSLGNTMIDRLERSESTEEEDEYRVNIHDIKGEEMGPVRPAKVVKRGKGRGAYRRARTGPATLPSIVDRIVSIERMLSGDCGDASYPSETKQNSAVVGENAAVMRKEESEKEDIDSRIRQYLNRYHFANPHSVGPDHSFGTTPSPSEKRRPSVGEVFPSISRHMGFTHYAPMRSQPSSPEGSTTAEEKTERRDMDVE